MIASSPELVKCIKEVDALRAKPRVIAEWNHNRYTTTTVDNFGYPEADNAYDLNTFPISSIVEPVRPTAGIAFAKAGEAMVTNGYANSPGTKRFYTTDIDSKYKYWTSPSQSDVTRAISNASPYVKYASKVWANKIYLCFENSWSAPSTYSVMVTTDGTNWTTVASNIAVGSNGVVELYLQANGTWTTTAYYANAIQLYGVRINVTFMDRISSYLNVIEMGARLVNDLTDYLISYDVDNEISDNDFISPVGIASSNTGNVTLSNIDGRFNNSNATSIYYGLINANTKITIDLGIDTTPRGGPGYEYIRQATMFVDKWENEGDTVNASIKDASKYLQEIKPNNLLIQDTGVGRAVWTMLDSVGFTSYAYSQTADAAQHIIPFFWTDAEKTVWEHIQDLCRATQSAAYFDQFGVLQIKTREAAFNKTQPVSWTLDGSQNGTKLADIEELSVTNEYEANSVTINYKPTLLAEDSQHRPISEVVWQPDGDVVLRSSALKADMTAAQMYMTIDTKDVAYWPYDGMANIRGEIVKFKGKSYWYLDKATNKFKNTTVYSAEDKLRVDNDLTAAGMSYRNYFSGTMYITERGVGETVAATHDTTIAGWLNTAVYGKGDVAMRVWNGGLKHLPADSILRLQTNSTFTGNHWYCASRLNSASNASNFYFGTRMRFPSSPAGTTSSAGLFICSSNDMRTMYCIDIMPTPALEKANARSYRNEVAVIRRNGNGTNSYIGKGAVYGIGFNQWFDVDVQCNGAAISVAINGRVVLNVVDPKPDLPNTSRQGLMARGFSVADFEYYYFASYSGGLFANDLDNSSFIDLRLGGYYSDQYYKDYAYSLSTGTKRISAKQTTTYKYKSNQRYFDEFGMQVHEIRPFTVKFEKPVIYSSLYISNTDQTVTPEYTGNPFGASFVIANAARGNSVVNGDDSSLGTDNVVTQKMMVTGRTVQQQDIKTYETKDTKQISARGEIAFTVDSDWIQSEGSAKSLGDWIVANWSKPSDNVEVDIYANPLVQVGDLVSINYVPQNMTETTHKYFVIGVSSKWDTGPVTSLSLRRANI